VPLPPGISPDDLATWVEVVRTDERTA
jgi:hypothetical protein